MRLDDWTNVTRSHSVEEPTNDPEVVVPIALELLRAYDPPRPVRLLGVRLASFGATPTPRGEASRSCASPSPATAVPGGEGTADGGAQWSARTLPTPGKPRRLRVASVRS